MTGEIVYDYTDLEDHLIHQVIRRPKPGGGKTFVQRQPDGHGEWIWTLEGVTRVPYRWVDLELARQDHPGRPVYIVEGEKDVDRLAQMGLVATTSPVGAAWEWPAAWAAHFDGFTTVVVIADNDEPGRKCARQRAGVVSAVSRDVRLIEHLPGIAEKGDISDWFDAGHSIDDLDVLVAEAPYYVAEVSTEPSKVLDIRWIDQIIDTQPDEPPILVDGLLRAGEFVVIVAARKYAKSWLGMQLAMAIADGKGEFLGLPVHNTARVLLAQGELNPAGSLRRWKHFDRRPPAGVAESFTRWRMRIEKVRTTQRDPDTDMVWTSEFYDAKLDPRLERTIVENQIGLLIVDPWAVFFSGSENSNDEAEAALSRLRDLTMATGVAIVIVHHISKVGEVREPEDLWRGASRLADWADTGITMLPHYKNEAAWKGAQLTRQQAKRYVDLHFMRRDTPTEDFSAHWDPRTGLWQPWEDPMAGLDDDLDDGPMHGLHDIIEVCAATGGAWATKTEASTALGIPRGSRLDKLLEASVRRGLLEVFKPGGNRTGYRVPGTNPQLHLVDPDDPGPSFEPDDEPERF